MIKIRSTRTQVPIQSLLPPPLFLPLSLVAHSHSLGAILLSVNPYKTIPDLYTKNVSERYHAQVLLSLLLSLCLLLTPPSSPLETFPPMFLLLLMLRLQLCWIQKPINPSSSGHYLAIFLSLLSFFFLSLSSYC